MGGSICLSFWGEFGPQSQPFVELSGEEVETPQIWVSSAKFFTSAPAHSKQLPVYRELWMLY